MGGRGEMVTKQEGSKRVVLLEKREENVGGKVMGNH